MEDLMISQLIEQLFNQPADAIIKLEKGLTNDNFKVTIDNKHYVLRVPLSNSEHIVNYMAEKKALDVVASLDIDAQTIYYDESTGIKITAFIDDLVGFNEYLNNDKFERVGKLMRKLHDAHTTIGIEFDPLKTYGTYASYVDNPMINPKDTLPYITFIQENRKVSTLCHNDWVPDNIGFHPDGDVLLDYEYAGDNDPMFDVTSFLSENHITDPISRGAFLKAYFNHNISQKQEETLLKWEAFHHILWCAWAQMMFIQRKKPIYLEIATQKKEAFKHINNQLKG
jgi:thiamine kinase-like enzyme